LVSVRIRRRVWWLSGVVGEMFVVLGMSLLAKLVDTEAKKVRRFR
jgi:hypothetical protein